MMFVLLLLLQLKVPDAAQFVGAPQGQPVGAARLEQRTLEVAALLRCPVCQGLSVADSPAAMAINMREQVRELLARGYSEEQILRYFERSYGEFVLLKPKFKGVNAIVWLLPALALFAGIAVLLFRRPKVPSETGNRPPATDDAYLARVRELVDKP